ncbi:nucleotidyltransferase family protein [Croceibacterium atlanticum]|nr:nucleotidyltransferase family protein [Croceibacterium atlanticum]
MPSRFDDLADLAQCLRGSVPADVEWETLLALANRSLVTPALADALQNADDVPEEVQAFLREIDSRARQRNAMLRAQLAEAAAKLNSIGLVPVMLKGTAMLADHGDGECNRILSDLDIMLPQDRLEDAISALRELGYSYVSEAPNGWDVHALGREKDAGMIDLHSRIKIAAPLLDHAALADEAKAVALDTARVLVPSPDHQALIFIVHDQLQEYDYARGQIDLRHLVDLAILARRAQIDWSRLIRLMPTRHGRNAMRVQMRSLHSLLGGEVPDRMVRGIWPRLQHKRRLLQLRYPPLASLFTMLTLLVDPPINPPLEGGREGVEHPERRGLWRLSRLLELSRSRPLPTKA